MDSVHRVQVGRAYSRAAEFMGRVHGFAASHWRPVLGTLELAESFAKLGRTCVRIWFAKSGCTCAWIWQRSLAMFTELHATVAPIWA